MLIDLSNDDHGDDVDENGTAPVWALGFQRLYGINDAGEVSKDSKVFRTDGLIVPAQSVEATSVAEFSLGQDSLEIGPGATIVLGVANSGKTLLSRTLRDRNEGAVEIIRYREPESDSLLYERDLVERLHEAIHGPARLIFIDSLRTVFYTSGGATGKGGVNMGIFELLTAYDLIGRATGKNFAFALNPMTTDEQALEFYLEAARGSVSYTIHATSPRAFRLSSRTAPNRDWVERRYNPPAQKGQRATQANLIAIQADPESISDLYTFTSR